MSGAAKAGAASLWHSLRMVAWSFLGIRKASGLEDDMARVNPFHVIVVGIAAAALFVVGLVILVNWVVAK